MMVAAFLALAVPERIVAVDNYVVAYGQGKTWRVPDERFASRHASATFRPFAIGSAGGAARTLRFEWSEDQGGTYLSGQEMRPMLAGGVPRAPRRVRTETPQVSDEAACRRFLQSRGVSLARAQVRRVLRVDLDGDGTDERLIEASVGTLAASAPRGAYSLVLLRAVRNGKAVETALEFSPAAPGGTMAAGCVRAVADLDGDGRMEVLTTVQGIDALGARLWSYRMGRATKLAENGIGV